MDEAEPAAEAVPAILTPKDIQVAAEVAGFDRGTERIKVSYTQLLDRSFDLAWAQGTAIDPCCPCAACRESTGRR